MPNPNTLRALTRKPRTNSRGLKTYEINRITYRYNGDDDMLEGRDLAEAQRRLNLRGSHSMI